MVTPFVLIFITRTLSINQEGLAPFPTDSHLIVDQFPLLVKYFSFPPTPHMAGDEYSITNHMPPINAKAKDAILQPHAKKERHLR